jgi:hypothetical protein
MYGMMFLKEKIRVSFILNPMYPRETNGKLYLNTTNCSVTCTPKTQQTTKKHKSPKPWTPPAHHPPAAPVLKVSPIVICPAVDVDCHNMAMYFFVQLTIFYFIDYILEAAAQHTC